MLNEKLSLKTLLDGCIITTGIMSGLRIIHIFSIGGLCREADKG